MELKWFMYECRQPSSYSYGNLSSWGSFLGFYQGCVDIVERYQHAFHSREKRKLAKKLPDAVEVVRNPINKYRYCLYQWISSLQRAARSYNHLLNGIELRVVSVPGVIDESRLTRVRAAIEHALESAKRYKALYYWLVDNESIGEAPTAEIQVRGEELFDALAELNIGMKLLPQSSEAAERLERELTLFDIESVCSFNQP